MAMIRMSSLCRSGKKTSCFPRFFLIHVVKRLSKNGGFCNFLGDEPPSFDSSIRYLWKNLVKCLVYVMSFLCL